MLISIAKIKIVFGYENWNLGRVVKVDHYRTIWVVDHLWTAGCYYIRLIISSHISTFTVGNNNVCICLCYTDITWYGDFIASSMPYGSGRLSLGLKTRRLKTLYSLKNLNRARPKILFFKKFIITNR